MNDAHLPRIPVAGPWVTDLEARYVADAALNDWYGSAAQSVGQFEREFAAHVGVRYAAAVPHCTSALHLALLALDIGPGDEVIVPESTWVATAAPIHYVGAEPVFVDIDPQTWQLSAASVERSLTPRTKAIMTVDLYGGVPDMDAINAVATHAGVPVVEDAAQSIGSLWRTRPAGALGEIATFSFHGTKTVTTGEGGMLVTDRTDLFDRVARLRDHGRTAADFKFFVTSEIGYKYRMSSLQAAFGRAQLSRLDELLERKRQIFAWYAARLGHVDGLLLNQQPPGTTNTYWMVTMAVDQARRLSTRDMMTFLDTHQIDSRPFFPPLSSLPAFAEYPSSQGAAARNTVAYDISSRAINLPSAMNLTEDLVDRVCGVVLEMVNAQRAEAFGMKAVILAGGRGTRITEESQTRPKPMVEIGGQPILWHIMKIYGAAGINEFVILLGYKGYMIKEYFANYFLHRSDITIDLARDSITVHQSTSEPWVVTLLDTGAETMTGGRLLRARDHLGSDPFCLTYGDGVTDLDVRDVIALHEKKDALVTVTAVQPPARYGRLMVGDDHEAEFEEKPRGDGGWVNGGFFVANPEVFDYIDGDETIFERQPLERLSAEDRLSAYRHDGFWYGMDTLWDKIYLDRLWDEGAAPWKLWRD